MRKILLFLLSFVSVALNAQYVPAGDSLKTRWAAEVSPQNVLPEYPRPLLRRSEWKSLNGLWNYAVRPCGMAKTDGFDGEILVPFCIESSLSGVQRYVGEDNELWYQRDFVVPQSWANKRVVLNFGAVDWRADVWINDVFVGSHEGGYTPFSFDITPALNKKGNTITVRVWDPTNKGEQPRGKQNVNPHGIWYTPVTGIWQTVWLEPVNNNYISRLVTVPDVDAKSVTIDAVTASPDIDAVLEVVVFENDNPVASAKSVNGEKLKVQMPDDLSLWSPETPFLYTMKVSLYKNGKVMDDVNSYFAMRKFSTAKDDDGIVRLHLNDEPVFMFGPLDQGWWCDGLYTAPTDEALLYDVQKTKELGFNMIRKHVKVEPARWYYHCDSLGIIVWQDMPSGGKGQEWITDRYYDGVMSNRSARSEEIYKKEWKEIMDYLYSVPSIGVWVPFNEAWGQFNTPEVAEWTKSYDPSRLVNPASGGNHHPVGDILDIHHYPEPSLYMYDSFRATVLGEYGGIGRVVEGHTWMPTGWGYVQYDSKEEATDVYVNYAETLLNLIPKGFSAAVYTQTSDCEKELNGLMTYDRAEVKFDEERLVEINKKISNYFRDKR